MSEFTCSRCGKKHPGPPRAYQSKAPALWYDIPVPLRKDRCTLNGDLCFIRDATEVPKFFIAGNLEIPVEGEDDPLIFTTWVAIEGESASGAIEGWNAHGEQPSFPGTIGNNLAGYPETLGLAAVVHPREPGVRPRIVASGAEHPVAREQRSGVSPDRVREIAEILAHPVAGGVS